MFQPTKKTGLIGALLILMAWPAGSYAKEDESSTDHMLMMPMMNQGMMMNCPHAMMRKGSGFWNWMDDDWEEQKIEDLSPELAEAIGIGAKQVKEIAETRKVYGDSYRKIHKQIQATRKQIQKLYRSDSYDVDTMTAHYKELYDGLFALAEARLQLEHSVNRVLNEKQRQNILVLQQWMAGIGAGSGKR